MIISLKIYLDRDVNSDRNGRWKMIDGTCVIVAHTFMHPCFPIIKDLSKLGKIFY